MDFRFLQARLVSHIQGRVRNGEISERGLARLTGISQPHIHNVLKGIRLFSMGTADQILQSLRIDLRSLLPEAAAGTGEGFAARDVDGHRECRTVALLDGWIGREYPFPQAAGLERYPFRAADVDRLESPAAVRFARDPLRASQVSGYGVVLLECAEAVRREPDGQSYYAVDLGGGGTIGLVRSPRRDSSLWVRHADAWECIPMEGRGPLDVIQGRVRLFVRQL